MKLNINAIWKKLLSHTKSTWGFDDYPVYYYKINKDNVPPNIVIEKEWKALIHNWVDMQGSGVSKKDALIDLKNNFESYKQNHTLPRPGTKVPIKFADSTQINQFKDFAVVFCEKILDLDYYECFISDGSRITDLMDYDDNEIDLLQRINNYYQLDLKDLGDGNMVRLLKLISELNNNKS